MVICMKANNVNTLLKAIALLFTVQFSVLKPVQMPACLMEFNKGNGINYIENCKKIDEYVKNSGMLHVSTMSTNNTAQMLTSIQNQLDAIEKEFLSAEQEALLAIKKKYQITHEVWQKFTADLHRIKTVYTKSMQKSHPDAVHDPAIPTNIYKTLITLLKKNNINPYSIHLKLVSDPDKIAKSPNTIAQAANYISSLETSKELTLLYTYKPSAIELFPQMIEEPSMSNKISTCAHEIQHIIQHHHLTETLLAWYLDDSCNISYSELEKIEEFHRLKQIHESQAEILSATKDPKIAECLKTKRETNYYPDCLYEEHFFQLAHIDMLWKTHTYLKDYNKQRDITYMSLCLL